MTTDTELLVLDRGQGKTGAIVTDVCDQLHQSLGGQTGPDRHRTGIVFHPHGSHADRSIIDRIADALTGHAENIAYRKSSGILEVRMPDPGHRWGIRVMGDAAPTAYRFDSLRGLLHTVGWVDEVADFEVPILELAADHLIDVRLATMTPARLPRPRVEPAIAYNPRLVRHQLARVARTGPGFMVGPDRPTEPAQGD